MRPLLLALLPLLPALGAQDEPTSHLEVDELGAIDAALARARAYLIAFQAEDGAFTPRARPEVDHVASTALALWALSETTDTAAELEPCRRAASYLRGFLQPDGGLYDPQQPLRVYTSGVAAQALRSFSERSRTPEDQPVWRSAELYAYRHGTPESIVDAEGPDASGAADRARELLGDGDALDADQRRALRFLEELSGEAGRRGPLRTRAHGWRLADADARFSYEDVLPIVYRPLAPEHDLARRALAAIRADYTLERNPDLTRRFGGGGFQEPHQGIYYYYLVLARTLSTYRSPILRLEDGEERDWVRELSRRLLALQREDGSWWNASQRWWEGEPVLVTSYAMIALDLCRRMDARRGVPDDAGR